MTHRLRLAICGAVAAVLSGIVSAQAPRAPGAIAGRGATGGPSPAVRSPEVHADHRVTFRLRAPAAASVDLVGEVLQGKGPQAMTRDADGVWSVTIGPLPPEIWIYNFRIQGVEFPDPANISLMPRAAGTANSSFVEVPGDGAAFYDARPVPHGDVRMVLYESNPYIERNYRVHTDADRRAIGGLSMGGFQSIEIGLAHPELFRYVLAYSGGFGGLGPQPSAIPIESQSSWKELLANPATAKRNLRLLFLGSGQPETGMLTPGQRLVSLFQEQGVNARWSDYPGGHVFSVWRNHLHESLPLLFKQR